jgi:hypothetical protein
MDSMIAGLELARKSGSEGLRRKTELANFPSFILANPVPEASANRVAQEKTPKGHKHSIPLLDARGIKWLCKFDKNQFFCEKYAF